MPKVYKYLYVEVIIWILNQIQMPRLFYSMPNPPINCSVGKMFWRVKTENKIPKIFSLKTLSFTLKNSVNTFLKFWCFSLFLVRRTIYLYYSCNNFDKNITWLVVKNQISRFLYVRDREGVLKLIVNFANNQNE